jgi:protocatechuate 3,4-dioxygenase, alpha subunit
MKLVPSGSQTVGPFFRIGLEHLCARDAAATDAEKVTIRGKVIDGEGAPVPDALLEIWHADADGRFIASGPDASGFPCCFTRATTGDGGTFAFSIRRPGAIACEEEATQAPHIAVLFFARGLMRHLMTRMYFPGEEANERDPLLQLVPRERRQTLIARQSPDEPGALQWDVVLQGENETVFFAW